MSGTISVRNFANMGGKTRPNELFCDVTSLEKDVLGNKSQQHLHKTRLKINFSRVIMTLIHVKIGMTILEFQIL